MRKKKERRRRLETLLDVLKSWKGPRPDYENPDFSRWNQTEAEYQEEQRRWLESRKKTGRRKKKQRR